MKSRDDQTKEEQSRSVASSLSRRQRNADPTAQLVDKRPEVVAKQKLQESIDQETGQIAQFQPITQLIGGYESEEDEGPESQLIERKKRLRRKIMETKYKIAHSENNDEISVLNELLSQFQAKFGEVVDKINQLHAST